jgi:hypothetical protein
MAENHSTLSASRCDKTDNYPDKLISQGIGVMRIHAFWSPSQLED